MEEDREYNACKALDPQIDNEDDVNHSSPDYEINEREIQKQEDYMDAMSGRGELGDRDLVVDFYGPGGRAEYRTGRTRADGADSIILNGADWAEYRTGRTRADGADSPADGADWWTGRLADGRTTES